MTGAVAAVSLLFLAALACILVPPVAPAQNASARAHANAAVKALQQWYTPQTGLYNTTGWWNSANAITTLANYSRIAHTGRYRPIFRNTLRAAQTGPNGAPGFLNTYYDDEGWWALAWIDAYDLTRDQRYLDMSKRIFADMSGGWDSTCGGGIWWSKDRTYKNAIANELFFRVAAELGLRTGGKERRGYADWTRREWTWFAGSGMINSENLINDGLVIDKA